MRRIRRVLGCKHHQLQAIEIDRHSAVAADGGKIVALIRGRGPGHDRVALLDQFFKEAGFSERQVAFVTSYADRDDAAFKGSVSELAWRSFAWFMSEPDHIMVLHRGAGAEQARLSDLMGG